MKFDRQGDVDQALTHSVMMYKGKAVMVVDTTARGGELCVHYEVLNNESLPKGMEPDGVVAVSDDELSPVPPMLGYVNFKGKAVYPERSPMRQWKRGLRMRVLRNVFPGLQERDLARSLEDDYPPFKLARAALKEGMCESVAFHKRWALTPRGLAFRGFVVGNTDLKLKEQFSYLQSLLDEAVKQ